MEIKLGSKIYLSEHRACLRTVIVLLLHSPQVYTRTQEQLEIGMDGNGTHTEALNGTYRGLAHARERLLLYAAS